MHCSKCLNHVPYGAKFCPHCGEAIAQKTIDAAYKKTVWGKLQRLEDWYKTIALKKVTESWIFRGAVLLIILGVGIFNVYKNGNELKIMPSETYTVQYNTKLDEYYICTAEKEIALNLYVPQKSGILTVCGYDEDDTVLETRILTAKQLEEPDALKVESDAYAYLTLNVTENEKPKSSLRCTVVIE